ncbi:ligand-binding sensor domain-containing protein [Clostridium sp.]|uniref:ligand-binding sensor domain-containing protein n=1 Tax=Clostridium sp. TaxID=1506 RepID=UPI003BB122D3
MNLKNKYLMIILAVIIIKTNFSINVQAKEYNRFNNISIEDGLSQATVETMMQDSKGYIWLGTNDGLDRYNGYTFKKYSYEKGQENSLVNSYILDIKEDSEGNIWVATAAGISKIYNDGEKVQNYTSDSESGNLSNDNTTTMLISNSNKIYVGTAEGINLYDKKTDKFNLIYPELKEEYVNSLAEDKYGNIWAGTENGLYKINVVTNAIERFESTDDVNTISENYIYKVYYDGDKHIWVGTYDNGFCKLNIENNKVTRYLLTREDGTIRGAFVKNFLKDSKGNIWICTDEGVVLFEVDKNIFTWYENKVHDPHSLIDNNTFSILEDYSGLIWIGTYSGVSTFDPYNTIEHYKNDPFNKNSINEKAVSGIYEDDDGLLWIGTSSSGVNILNKDRDVIECLTTANGLSNNRITDIVGAGDYIFIATYNGLNVVNKISGEIEIYDEEDGLASNIVKKLFYDELGYLYIGSASGLDALDLNDRSVINLNYILEEIGISSKNISAIYKDSKRNFWLGTFVDNGLIKIDADTGIINVFKNKENDSLSLSDNTIRCIGENSKGEIWIGTSFGLNKYNEKDDTFTSYTTKDGLANDTIYGILFDDKDNPWVSTNLGIAKINIDTNVINNLNITDGLQSNEFNGNSYFKTKKGEFIFGGINGFNLFIPDEVVIKSSNLNIVFDDFKVNGKSIESIDNKVFKPSEKNIRVGFFLPDYKSMKNIKYYYTLDENEEKWIPLPGNYVDLANLSSGDYELRIKSRGANGSFSDVKSVKFRILPAFWKSKQAILIYILIAILIFIHSRYKIKKLDEIVMKRTKQLSDEMEKNTELLNKVIELEIKKNNYFVNLSHELRTPLNVIYSTQQLIIELNKNGILKEKLDYYMDVIARNSKRLLKMINDIIDTSKIESGCYHLNITETNIVYLVEESVLTLKDYIEGRGVNLIVDPEMEEKTINCDNDAIERCIINLVSNAAKFTEAGDSITVRIIEEKSQVKIEVIDTGIGIAEEYHETIFNRFNQIVDSNSEKNGGSGLGLTITRQIIELHNGKIYVESKPGNGSKFTIILPI